MGPISKKPKKKGGEVVLFALLIDDGEKGRIRGVNESFGFLLVLPWHIYPDGGSSTKQTTYNAFAWYDCIVFFQEGKSSANNLAR